MHTVFTLQPQHHVRASLHASRLAAKPAPMSSMTIVEFQPDDKRVEAKAGEPLEAVAKSAGVEIKYKCRKGEW